MEHYHSFFQITNEEIEKKIQKTKLILFWRSFEIVLFFLLLPIAFLLKDSFPVLQKTLVVSAVILAIYLSFVKKITKKQLEKYFSRRIKNLRDRIRIQEEFLSQNIDLASEISDAISNNQKLLSLFSLCLDTIKTGNEEEELDK